MLDDFPSDVPVGNHHLAVYSSNDVISGLLEDTDYPIQHSGQPIILADRGDVARSAGLCLGFL